MISEPHAVGGETIDVRCLNDSIARTTQRVEPLIVGEDENTIALTRQFCGIVRRRPGCVTADKTKKCEAKDLDAKSSVLVLFDQLPVAVANSARGLAALVGVVRKMPKKAARRQLRIVSGEQRRETCSVQPARRGQSCQFG